MPFVTRPGGGSMTGYMLRRLVISLPVLFGITVFTFLFINLAPGDPIDALIDPAEGQRLSQADLMHLREELGLNKPLPVRYAIWLGQLARGNLGYSYADRRPVTELLAERIAPTLELTATSLLLSLVLAIPLGIFSALRQYSWLDYVLTLLSFLVVSVPGFFLALGAIYLFAVKLDLLPTSGMFTVGKPWTWRDHLQHLLLPVAILSLERVGPFMRYVRSSMLEVVGQDYVTTARAKGLAERVVIYRHALRNALMPLITIVGLSLPGLFGGVVILETIFSWPGIGWLGVLSVSKRDYPVLMALGFISATLILVSNLLADICYAVADPRVRYR
jgi:peptide/nickel transport system permease protein